MVCIIEKCTSLFLTLSFSSLVLCLKLHHSWTQTKFSLFIHTVLTEEEALRVKGVRGRRSCAHSVSGVVVESILLDKRLLQLKCGCLCMQ